MRKINPTRQTPHKFLKQKLASFIREEFQVKRPLEARLIRLKPNIVFKKGTMLPSLLIKQQGKIMYLGYFDFGDQVRFYFFDRDGISLGAQNYPKQDQMLDELKGKAQTILKLPKKDPMQGIDVLSQQIQRILSKEIQKVANSFGVSTPRTPTVSTLQRRVYKSNLRFGMKQEDQILHINRNFWQKPMKNFLYARETYLAFLDPTKLQNSQIFLGTVWGIIQHSAEISSLLAEFKKIQSSQPALIQKSIEWLQKKVIPIFNLTSNIRSKEISGNLKLFTDFVFEASIIIRQNFQSYQPFIWEIFLFWILKVGFTKYIAFHQNRDRSSKTAWLNIHLYSLLFQNAPILHQYRISLRDLGEDLSFELFWFHYLSEYYSQGHREQYKSKSKVLFLPSPWVLPEHKEFITQFEENKLQLAFRLIPVQILIELPDYCHRMFENNFKHSLLEVDGISELILGKNDEEEFKVQFTNTGDWILPEITYSIEWNPINRIEARITQAPKTKFFDTAATIYILVKSKAIAGEIKVTINGTYQSPFYKEKKTTLSFLRFQVVIKD